MTEPANEAQCRSDRPVEAPEGGGLHLLGSFCGLLFDELPFGMAVTDFAGNLFAANRAMSELTGYSVEELAKIGILPLYVGIGERDRMLRDVLERGKVKDREVSLKRKDGSLFTALLDAVLVESGGTRYLVTTGLRDVTGLRRAEAEARLRESAIWSSINAIAIADLDGKITYVNPSFLGMWGYGGNDEVIGRSVVEFWEDESKAADALRAVAGGEAWVGELVAKRKDGTFFEAQLSANAFRDERGDKAWVVASLVDVSPRKNVERELALRDLWFRTLLENSQDVIGIVDEKGFIRYQTPSAERVFGYSAREMFGRKVTDFAPPEDGEFYRGVFEDLLRSPDTTRRFVGRMLRRDGRLLEIETAARYVPSLGGIVVDSRDVTERSKAEHALRMSERERALILDSTQEMFVYYDTDLTIRWANRASAVSVGEDPEDLVGRRCHEVWHHRSEPCERCPVLLARDTGMPQEREDTIPDGRHFFLRGYPVFDDQGLVIGMVEFTLDITDRKRAESTLRKSEERFRTLFESTPVGIAVVSPDGSLQAANGAFHEMFGYGPGELEGRSYPEVVFPDDLPSAAGEIDRMNRGAIDRFHLEHRFVRKSGSRLWGDSLGFKFKGSGDSPSQFIVFIYDVSERKRIEGLLSETSQFNQQVISCAREGVIVYDRELRCLVWNPYMEDLTGLDAGRVIGRSPWELFSFDGGGGRTGGVNAGGEPTAGADADGGHAAGLRRAFAGETVVHPAFLYRIPETGLEGWARSTQAPLRNMRGDIIGVIENVHDITLQKKNEEERKKLEEQLFQSQKMESVGRLAGGIAHDFNNLLTSILGNAELALMTLSAGDPVYADMVEIRKAANRAANLTRQLLAFSRKQIIEPKVININEIIVDMDKMLRRLIGENVRLSAALEQDLMSVKMDPGQVEQILTNLVVNARDAMPRGGEVRIQTANVALDEKYAREHLGVTCGEYVLMSVSDTGVGMDGNVKSHLFEPFFTTKEKGKGTGLGLSTCYGIVKQNRGYITARSEPGVGSTFEVFLPVIPSAPEAGRGVRAFDLPKGKETVLVAEDDPSVRGMIGKTLSMNGYTVVEAPGGLEAVDAAAGFKSAIDLLLTDVVMPSMGGRDLAASLKKRFPLLLVLYMSGYADDTIVQEDVPEEGVAFIHKPFSPAALVRKVRETLDRRPR